MIISRVSTQDAGFMPKRSPGNQHTNTNKYFIGLAAKSHANYFILYEQGHD